MPDTLDQQRYPCLRPARRRRIDADNNDMAGLAAAFRRAWTISGTRRSLDSNAVAVDRGRQDLAGICGVARDDGGQRSALLQPRLAQGGRARPEAPRRTTPRSCEFRRGPRVTPDRQHRVSTAHRARECSPSSTARRPAARPEFLIRIHVDRPDDDPRGKRPLDHLARVFKTPEPAPRRLATARRLRPASRRARTLCCGPSASPRTARRPPSYSGGPGFLQAASRPRRR